MKVKGILFLLSIIFLRISNSQNVKGFVYDNDNHPVLGVSVENIKDGSHTHSQENGAFVLQNVAINDTLLFVFISFKSKKIVVTDTLNPIKVFLDFDAYLLDEIHLSNTADNLNVIVNADLKITPVQSSQDLLRKVPGLFIGQHAGGGKAEQIFLRGFDIDHGTDINISVDGMPVNIVSHAHGQGYADLHFLIPEVIDKIEFDKGTYNAEKGNFATAGYVHFKTYDSLPNSKFQLERGQFNTLRNVMLLDLISTEKKNAYIATEYIKTDGPFISPQNFNRINLLAKYSSVLPNGKDLLKLSASYFTSKWNASQLPSRAVENGTISRFGAIDITEGGKTDRMNLIMNFDKIINQQTFVENTMYLTKYNFDLFSNFTFFFRRFYKWRPNTPSRK